MKHDVCLNPTIILPEYISDLTPNQLKFLNQISKYFVINVQDMWRIYGIQVGMFRSWISTIVLKCKNNVDYRSLRLIMMIRNSLRTPLNNVAEEQALLDITILSPIWHGHMMNLVHYLTDKRQQTLVGRFWWTSNWSFSILVLTEQKCPWGNGGRIQ